LGIAFELAFVVGADRLLSARRLSAERGEYVHAPER
jgi:hypothetical protein